MVIKLIKIVGGELEVETVNGPTGDSWEPVLGPAHEVVAEGTRPPADPPVPQPRCGLLYMAQDLEKISRVFRHVASRYDAERVGGMTIGKAYRLMYMMAEILAKDGVLPVEESWVRGLIADMQERAKEFNAGARRSGDFPDDGSTGDGGYSLPG